MQRWFDLNGAALSVIAADESLMAPLLPYLEELSAPASPPAGFELVIERGSNCTAPADAAVLYDGMLPEGPACRLVQAGDIRWLDVPGQLSFAFSLRERRGRLAVCDGAESILAGTPAILAIDAALRASGQHLIHAAALHLRTREAGFILFAPSGAGKTTTALALALSGFGFLADDATVLVPPAASRNEFRVWGLPRALKVHRRTCGLLPRIGPLLGSSWDSGGEQVLSRTTLKAVAEVCGPRSVPLAAIVMLQSRVEGAHVLRKADKTDIMTGLANDNVFRSRQGLQSDQLSRFEVLAAALAATPAYELRVGSDLASLGPLVSSLIEAA